VNILVAHRNVGWWACRGSSPDGRVILLRGDDALRQETLPRSVTRVTPPLRGGALGVEFAYVYGALARGSRWWKTGGPAPPADRTAT